MPLVSRRDLLYFHNLSWVGMGPDRVLSFPRLNGLTRKAWALDLQGCRMGIWQNWHRVLSTSSAVAQPSSRTWWDGWLEPGCQLVERKNLREAGYWRCFVWIKNRERDPMISLHNTGRGVVSSFIPGSWLHRAHRAAETQRWPVGC